MKWKYLLQTLCEGGFMADLNSLGYMIVSVYEYLYDLQDHKKMEFLNWFCRAWVKSKTNLHNKSNWCDQETHISDLFITML